MDIPQPIRSRQTRKTPAIRTMLRGWDRAWDWTWSLSFMGRLQPLLYLLPALLAVGVWVYLPLARIFELSFYRWNMLPTAPKTWVGLENYRQVLTLPEMGSALGNTLIYVVGLLPISVGVPLVIALLTHELAGRSRGLYRLMIFAPMLMAPVVVAIIWRWMLHPLQGIVNVVYQHVTGGAPLNFFNNPDLAIWAIIFITGWKLMGFSVLVFSAALTGVSKDYLDAAAVDGASKLQAIRHITLPLISPTIMLMVVLTILLSVQWTFPLINVLTRGGPVESTNNIYYLLWRFGFQSFNVGWASAAGVVFFIGFSLVAWALFKVGDRMSYHER